MLADQVLGYRTTARERHVGYFKAEFVLQHSGQQGILLTLSGASHCPGFAFFLYSGNIIIERLDVRIGVNPQQKRIEGHAADRRKGADIDAEIRILQRGCIEAVERDHDDMVIAAFILEITQGLCAGTTRLIDRDKRLVGEVILLDNALHQPGHLVSATARSSHYDKLDWLFGLPCKSGTTHHG